MQDFNGQICVTGAEAKAAIGEHTYCYLLRSNKIANAAGYGCNGKSALYPVDDFPLKYKAMLYDYYPELSDEQKRREMISEQNYLISNIMPDPKARAFFTTYEKPNGAELSPEEKSKYENSAKILNALRVMYERSYSMHSRSGKAHKFRIGDFWRGVERHKDIVSAQFPNCLPWHWKNLQSLAGEYAGNNYAALLNGRIGNQNRTKKQRDLLTKIVLSIYADLEKPFKSDVTRIYNEFVLGVRELYIKATGEAFNRADFYRNGEPETISDALVFNIIENPLNRKIVDTIRNDFHYNQQHHNAAMQRISPEFSLSKISADDRDLVRRCWVPGKDGKSKVMATVHAYYIYDVASGAIIGAAHSLKKDTNLVMECYRNLWNNLRTWGLGTPLEVEVENHLMKGGTMEQRLHNTFTHVSYCAPMNSQEKRAEHFNKAKKYYGEYAEFKVGMAKGRHHAQHEAYLGTRKKVFDEHNDTYEEQLPAWDYNSVVAEDLAHIELYNKGKHTAKDKKTKELKYGGMTRIQVLQMRQNSKCGALNWRLICKEWGVERETSLKRGASFTVDYREWWLSDVSLIQRFKAHNTTATAYFIPDAEGRVNEIFVYQDNTFIDSPRHIGSFQEAIAEQTDADLHIMHTQLGFKNAQKSLASQTADEYLLGKIGSIKTEQIDSAFAQVTTSETIRYLPPEDELLETPDFVESDYTQYSPEEWAALSLQAI
ncbi:MAG: hypothetical protein LBU90_10325 [Bacteroidales bacterium]|jgi:hypothetical protein|nr:hypothetical protein [Bacteroidales bacterium]